MESLKRWCLGFPYAIGIRWHENCTTQEYPITQRCAALRTGTEAEPNISQDYLKEEEHPHERRFTHQLSGRESVSIPIAAKIGPFFSSPGNMAKKLVAAGADGIVLFNRFLQPDIDIEELQTKPKLELSSNFELLLPLRWIAILHGRVDASLAHTSGIHSVDGLVKTLMAGADVGMIASLLYRHGLAQIGVLRDQLAEWLEGHEYESVRQVHGSMSQKNCPDPTAFERGNYMKVLTNYTLKQHKFTGA